MHACLHTRQTKRDSRSKDVDDEEVTQRATDADESDEDADGIVPEVGDEGELLPVRMDEQVVGVVDVSRVRHRRCRRSNGSRHGWIILKKSNVLVLTRS